MSALPLSGRRILVVEDEYIIAADLCRTLQKEGAVVIGPAASVSRALDLIEAEPRIDGAILDVNLGGEKSFRVAAALQARAIPFLFATGYNSTDVPGEWQQIACVTKPAQPASLKQLWAGAPARAGAENGIPARSKE